MNKSEIQAARERCECGDKIGFHNLKRRLTAALEALEESESARETLAELHESIASQLEAAGYVTPTPVAVEQLLKALERAQAHGCQDCAYEVGVPVSGPTGLCPKHANEQIDGQHSERRCRVDAERQLAEAQATIEQLAEAHVERFDKAADRILSKEGDE